MSTHPNHSRIAARSTALAALLAAPALLVGCNNAGEGALSGGALGAGAGAIIGSLSGDAGTGAAIGAVSGALGGAVIGDQNERNDRRARERSYYYGDRPYR
jgi:osmotically inducible lipoprotein OsmB